MSSLLVKSSETPPPGRSCLANQTSRLFWLGFFLPVNILFHGIAYALLGIEPDLDFAVWVIVAVKTAFFGLLTYAVVVLWMVWQKSAREQILRRRLLCLFAGLFCIVIFLAVHSESAYRFGLFEREIRREVVKINDQEIATQQAGVILTGARVAGRAWSYEYRVAGLSLGQLDLPKFRTTVRASLVSHVCADPWIQRLVSANVTVHYVYRDREDQVISDEVIDKNACATIRRTSAHGLR